jgi:hypothetical protein
MFVVCCQVEVSATSWSLVQRSPTDCGASLCADKKPRERGGHKPVMGYRARKKKAGWDLKINVLKGNFSLIGQSFFWNRSCDFYKNRRFITTFKTTRYWPLFWITLIQSTCLTPLLQKQCSYCTVAEDRTYAPAVSLGFLRLKLSS